MRDDALRQVISLDAVGDRECLQLGHEPPVAADHALDQARMTEVVEPALLAVALSGRVDQRQTLRPANAIRVLFAGFDEALLQRDGDVLGEADADKAGRGKRVAIVDQLHRFARGDDLALLETLEALQQFASTPHGVPLPS